MTRAQAEEKIRNKWGFLPYGGVALSLYELDEEVPDNLVDYELKRNPHQSPATFIVGSKEVVNAINDIQDSYGDVDHIDGIDEYDDGHNNMDDFDDSSEY